MGQVYLRCDEKGKPPPAITADPPSVVADAVTRGRKAYGSANDLWRIAGLPKERRPGFLFLGKLNA